MKKKSPEKEIRIFTVTAEKRDDGAAGKISGYAAVFNKPSEDMGFIERIAPGAFKKALKNSDVRALFNHDSNIIIGRQGVNLTLKEDDKGLFMSLDPIDDPDYRKVAGKVASGLITQQSFGFTVAADEWKNIDKDTPERTITEVRELFDVSPVTFPAYPDTSVALRSLETLKSGVTAGTQEGVTARQIEIEQLETEETIIKINLGGLL